jgi:primosomal protein N'
VRRELDKLKAGRGAKEKTGEADKEEATLFDQMSPPVHLAPSAGPEVASSPFRDLIIAGPAPAPLLRAETFYRYQLMLRTRAMSRMSQALAGITGRLSLPEDVMLTVDIDPVSLG